MKIGRCNSLFTIAYQPLFTWRRPYKTLSYTGVGADIVRKLVFKSGFSSRTRLISFRYSIRPVICGSHLLNFQRLEKCRESSIRGKECFEELRSKIHDFSPETVILIVNAAFGLLNGTPRNILRVFASGSPDVLRFTTNKNYQKHGLNVVAGKKLLEEKIQQAKESFDLTSVSIENDDYGSLLFAETEQWKPGEITGIESD